MTNMLSRGWTSANCSDIVFIVRYIRYREGTQKSCIRWYDYNLAYKDLVLKVTYFPIEDLFCLEEATTESLKALDLEGGAYPKIGGYFEDWKNPSEEELIAFCLEHDIIY